MSKSRLVSGKVKKLVGSELDSDRSSFLNLANAEPDLGVPIVDGSILVAGIDGTRYWSPSVKVDVTGNLFLGTINSADGSTPIRLTANTVIEGNLNIDGIGVFADLTTQTIRAVDSSVITIVNSIVAQSDLEVQNNLTVNGNFTVLGSTTTINSTTLTVEDKNIELAKNSTSAANSDGAGITVIGPATPATIAYDADTDTWNFNKTIVGTVQGATSIQDIDDRIDLFFDNDINTTDSSSIVFIPSVEMRSNLTVENDASINNNLTVLGTIAADTVLVKGIITGIFAGAITGPDAIGLFNQLITQGLTTQDSSPLTVIPALIAKSDVTVENDLRVSNTVYAEKFIGDGSQLSGIVTELSIDDLTDVDTATVPPTAGQVLVWDNNNSIWKPGNIDSLIGYTGSQGDIGYTGSQGEIGYTGSQGELGYTGSVGYTGSQGVGFTGSQGEIGYTGSVGYTGSEGAGFTGSQGDLGYTGSQGIQGLRGYTGSAGTGGGGGGSSVGVANLYQSGNLIVFTGTQRWYAPFNLQFSEITGRVVQNANDDIEIEILKNGTLMTGLTIPVGLYSASTSGDDSVILTMDEGDYLTVDVIQVGTVVQPGSDLYIQFKYVNI
jgi:hypothetical protein